MDDARQDRSRIDCRPALRGVLPLQSPRILLELRRDCLHPPSGAAKLVQILPVPAVPLNVATAPVPHPASVRVVHVELSPAPSLRRGVAFLRDRASDLRTEGCLPLSATCLRSPVRLFGGERVMIAKEEGCAECRLR